MLRDVLRETWVNSDTMQESHEEGPQLRIQQAFLQGLQQAHKEILLELRSTLLKIVRLRFPKIIRLAKKQVALIDDLAALRDLIVKMSIAQNVEEAVLSLLEVDEDYEEEEE